MAGITIGQYLDGIIKDDGAREPVSRSAARGDLGRHARGPTGHGGHGHRRWQEFNFHVASMVWHRARGDDGGGGPIDRVTTRHEATMPGVRIKVCRVVKFINCRWSRYYVSDARKRIHGVILEVHVADEAWSTCRSNRVR